MNKEEKIKYLIDLGYTYNQKTGEVISHKGNILHRKNKENYKQISFRFNNKKYYLFQHQFAWYYIYGEIVECLDHINGIKDDNRISNLRSVTNQQNQFNTNAKGYHWDKVLKKYRARIRLNNELIHLGYFKTEEEARNIYLKAKEIYHKI